LGLAFYERLNIHPDRPMQCPLVVCCLLAEWPDTSFQGRLLNEITNAGENEMATQRSVLADFRRADAEGIGARFFRADLHFHTPASSDARGANRYGFNPYKLTYPTKQQQQADPLAVHNFQQGILDDARALATSMVQRFLEESLSIVAITDHNGIGTIWSDVQSRSFMDLRAPTWYELVDEAARAHNELVGRDELTILPGVEISTTGVHILAIFRPQHPLRKVHFVICDLLDELGLGIDDWGKSPKVGKASVVETIELITKKGGIPIPAHIDGKTQAVLKLYSLTGGAMKNVLTNPLLGAVEIVEPHKFTTYDKKLKQTPKDWLSRLRDKTDLPSLAYFQGSDAHDLPAIGKRFTALKMTAPSFSGLRTAIGMPSSRVRISDQHESLADGHYLHSLRVDNEFFGKRTFRFNRNLNCVIGRKGSGKSYAFHLMRAAAYPSTELKDGKVTLFVEQRLGGVSTYFAFSRAASQGTHQIRKLDPRNSTATLLDPQAPETRALWRPRSYEEDRVELLITDRAQLRTFLVDHFGPPSQANVEEFNRRFLIPRFLGEDDPLLQLELVAGAYELSVNTSWRRRKDPSFEGFFSQAHSLRRVVLFCMVIIMEEFGPAVIDAPEAHFDNQDILRYLLPIIRMYKDTRQIVLFSTNPVLAVNTDPDNYLLLETKGTRFRRILSGFAIDDDKRRPRLLEVIEGGMASFRKRAASYQAPDL